MKNYILTTLLVILIACNSNNQRYKITLLTSGLPDSTKIYLTDVQTAKDFDSSIVIKNQTFFNGHCDSLKYVTIRTKNFRDYLMFWIDNAPIKIDATNTSIHMAHISGSQFQNLNTTYLDLQRFWRLKKDSLEQLRGLAVRSDSLLLRKLDKTRDSFDLLEQKARLDFVKSNPDFPLNAYNLTYMMLNSPKEFAWKMYNAMSVKEKNNKWGKAVGIYLEKGRDLKIGDQIIDVRLPDKDGTTVSLSSLIGKYVLLEFWASWCGPCRAENPNLLKMYRKYSQDGFEIYGVSLDEDIDVWKSAIKADTLIWKTVSDLKGYLGETALTYKLNGVPMNYLVDPSGKIIDINIRDNALNKRLNEIFKH